MLLLTAALAGPTLTPLSELLAPTVLDASSPACEPASLVPHDVAIVARDALPASIRAMGVTAADLDTANASLRTQIQQWMDTAKAAGDTSLDGLRLCVGVWDDAKGPNSAAIEGRWLVIGVRDLQTMNAVHGAGMAATVEYTLGHEFGHILQQRKRLGFGGKTARGAELHADCLAGYLMALGRETKFSRITNLLAQNEARRIGDRHTDSANHHGTPEERKLAYDRGWAAGMMGGNLSAQARHPDRMLAVCALYADVAVGVVPL